MINWPLVILLTLVSIPGILIAIPRVIDALVGDIGESIKKRLSLLANTQTIIMVFLMALAGAVLSKKTGLNAPILDSLLVGNPVGHLLIQHLFPIFAISVATTVIFLLLYYAVLAKFLSHETLATMKRLRKSIGLDGCVLYGGIVEEVLVRWGLMNLIVFFALMFGGHITTYLIYLCIIISGLFFAIGHLPTYFAAGCEKTRFFAFSVISLNLIVSLAFGYLFWQYGLIAAMIGHASFHVIWWYYD